MANIDLEAAGLVRAPTVAPAAAPAVAPVAAVAGEGRRGRYLVSPVVDFLCLGGLSFIVMPLLLLLPVQESLPSVAAIAALIAHAVNHPHFAYSYQIFYRGYGSKAFGKTLPPLLRLRYLFAGTLVPSALLLFFAYCIAAGDARLLGMTTNLMTFLVGWHYVKQGYGMAMVDAVLKRQFYGKHEKRILLVNAYACWIFAWTTGNRYGGVSEYLGLPYHPFALGDTLWWVALALAAVTSLTTVAMLWRKAGAERRLPVNGLVGYFAALYPWLVLVTLNPLFLYVIAAFHSLQYLIVVWRFEMNRGRSQPGSNAPGFLGTASPSRGMTRFALFLLLGPILGYLGFWMVPGLLDDMLGYDRTLFGPMLFLFLFWLFINVHHYFLDNVMWRRENPETKRYLFAAS